MRAATLLQRVAVCLAVMGFCIPQVALAATPAPSQGSPVADVQLQPGGVLVGQVVTPENTAVAGTEVVLRTGPKQMVKGKTDHQGYFAFAGLRDGVYQVEAAKGSGIYRVWSQKIAPPAAKPGALIVAGKQTVRGQGIGGGLWNWVIVGGVVATAIAVPLAINNIKIPSTP